MNKNKFLNKEELIYLEQLLYQRLKVDTRDCLLLLVALKTGARASEVLSIRKEDLNYSQKSVYIRGLKGSNDRDLPLVPTLFNTLAKYALTVSGELIFPISYRRLIQIWDLYKPSDKCFHSLRHSRAIEVYKKSRNIHLVKTMLGHRSIQNSMIYLDFVESNEQLRKAML